MISRMLLIRPGRHDLGGPHRTDALDRPQTRGRRASPPPQAPRAPPRRLSARRRTRDAAEREAAPAARTAAPAGKTREGSKQALLVEMLKRPEGATIAQIVEATGWQPHTVRGAFAGALKKRLGLTVTSEKVEGTRVYRIAG